MVKGTNQLLKATVDANGDVTFVITDPGWPDPALWGIFLADLTRTVAEIYADAGTYSIVDAVDRIRAGLAAELD